jgi:PAS domain S-box
MKGRDTRTALRSVSDLRTGDHICGIYRTDEEHRDLVSAFIKDGLFRNEKVLYILDCHTAATITGYLEGYGADPATPQGPGQLVFASAADTYLKGGSFNPDAMIEFLGSETEKALSEGYSALRVTGEMSWAGRNLSGSDRLTEYEIHLNSFLESHTCTCLCQYDERLFPPSVLLDVLLTHPIAVIGRTLYDNFYYIPSVDLPGQNLGAVLFGHWKEGLATYAATRKRVEEMAEFPEQNPQPVCELGRDGQLRYCNPAGYRHFPDITNEGGRHLLFGDYTALFSELEKDPGTVILKETPFGGRWYELAVSYVPGRDSIRIYSTDISHRKSAGMALKESEEKFRLLADFTPDWEYWVDNEYRIVYMSPSCELITGYPAGDFYRTKNFIQEIIHPNDIGRYKIHESWMMNKKEAGELEFRIIRRDGTERWIRHSCRPVIDKAGRFLGIRVSNQDISGQKHAEREIQQKDKLLHMTGEMAKVGGWEFNAVTGAGSWTDEVARIHGLDPDVTTTMQFGVSFFTGESRKRIEQAIREAVEDARPYDLELEMMSADGLHKWVRTHGIPHTKGGEGRQYPGNHPGYHRVKRG